MAESYKMDRDSLNESRCYSSKNYFLLPSCKAALAGFVDGLYYKTLVGHPYQERVPNKQLNYVNELEFVHRLDIF
ncbi:hypothetical protein D3C75_812060 [compost metagenome]